MSLKCHVCDSGGPPDHCSSTMQRIPTLKGHADPTSTKTKHTKWNAFESIKNNTLTLFLSIRKRFLAGTVAAMSLANPWAQNIWEEQKVLRGA